MRITFVITLLAAISAHAQPAFPAEGVEVRAHLAVGSPKHEEVPAVLWLEPVNGTPAITFMPRGRYTLLQKNRTFLPHLQVVPVGAIVDFPNADPFFHNVFSLFDGKRFDLGLYEAGSSKSVTFAKEGVSYIFCNIHPEMSAVIVSLDTPLFAVADRSGAFLIPAVAPGDYHIHLWTEGARHGELEHTAQVIHVPNHPLDLGALAATLQSGKADEHTNKYGQPYSRPTQPIY